jgi:hypothetical protein
LSAQLVPGIASRHNCEKAAHRELQTTNSRNLEVFFGEWFHGTGTGTGIEFSTDVATP